MKYLALCLSIVIANAAALAQPPARGDATRIQARPSVPAQAPADARRRELTPGERAVLRNQLLEFRRQSPRRPKG